MKSAIDIGDTIDVIDENNGLFARVRVREVHFGKACSPAASGHIDLAPSCGYEDD